MQINRRVVKNHGVVYEVSGDEVQYNAIINDDHVLVIHYPGAEFTRPHARIFEKLLARAKARDGVAGHEVRWNTPLWSDGPVSLADTVKVTHEDRSVINHGIPKQLQTLQASAPRGTLDPFTGKGVMYTQTTAVNGDTVFNYLGDDTVRFSGVIDDGVLQVAYPGDELTADLAKIRELFHYARTTAGALDFVTYYNSTLNERDGELYLEPVPLNG